MNTHVVRSLSTFSSSAPSAAYSRAICSNYLKAWLELFIFFLKFYENIQQSHFGWNIYAKSLTNNQQIISAGKFIHPYENNLLT